MDYIPFGGKLEITHDIVNEGLAKSAQGARTA